MASDLNEKSLDIFAGGQHDSSTNSWADGFLAAANPMTMNSNLTIQHLAEAQDRLFCTPEKMKFDILDVFNDEVAKERGRRICKTTFDAQKQLDEFLKRDKIPHTRFISIPAPNSVKPLQITFTGAQKLLSSHHVGPDVLELFLSFANGGKGSEAGPGSLIFKQQPGGVLEMQYRFNYVEQAGKSWATRQIGVYHRRAPNGSGLSNLWIFLHPKNNSVMQKRLEAAVSSWSSSRTRPANWDLTHFLVLSSYFGDWRWFLKSLGGEIEHLANDALSLDFSNEAHDKRGLETLQTLHHLEDKVLPCSARLRSMLATVTTLQRYEEIFFPKENRDESVNISDELRSYETLLQGHLVSVELLEKRAQEILKLLSVALSLKSQATGTNINRNILSLTKDTVDDSATVRVVTIVTLIYLPASFVTGVLGMNLFTFQSQANPGAGFQVSEQVWIFFVLALPLTLLTVGSWYWMARSRKKQRAAERAAMLAEAGDV